MTPRISEQDEFLLSQLVDGDLPANEAAALRQRLAQEPTLRECFDELCRLNQALIARRTDQPAVDIESFHEQLMQRLTGGLAIEEQDEFLVGEFIDGGLSLAEQREIEARLQREPALRQCHERLTRLDSALRERRADQPVVNYARFRKQVMKKIAAEAPAAHATIRFPAWLRVAAPIAVAAAIALVVLFRPSGGLFRLPGSSPSLQTVVENTDQLNILMVTVAQNSPAADATPIEVQVDRGEAAQDSPAIQVNYAKNTQLADAIRVSDAQKASQPSRRVFFAAAAPAPTPSASGEGDLF